MAGKLITRYYKGLPIKILLNEGLTEMINLVDVSKIMGINIFQWLEQEEIKGLISMCEKVRNEVFKTDDKEAIIKIESSQEVYCHTLLFAKLTFKVDIALYLWFYSRECVESNNPVYK